jgi:hypothetical protein
LLVRLALFCVILRGFEPNLAVVGPKLVPGFSPRSGRREARAAANPSSLRSGPSHFLLEGVFYGEVVSSIMIET